MIKKKSRAELVYDLVGMEQELELVKLELKNANEKINEIDIYVRGLVHNGLPLREDTALKIIKKVLCIISPELKNTLG